MKIISIHTSLLLDLLLGSQQWQKCQTESFVLVVVVWWSSVLIIPALMPSTHFNVTGKLEACKEAVLSCLEMSVRMCFSCLFWYFVYPLFAVLGYWGIVLLHVVLHGWSSPGLEVFSRESHWMAATCESVVNPFLYCLWYYCVCKQVKKGVNEKVM